MSNNIYSINNFLECVAISLSSATVKEYGYAIKHYFRYLEKEPQDITREDLTKIYFVEAKPSCITEEDYYYKIAWITTLWKGKKTSDLPTKGGTITAMWSHENIYSEAINIGNTIFDFIPNYLQSPGFNGVFGTRETALKLTDNFTGLQICEVNFIQNAYELKLKNGKLRSGVPRWLPTENVDVVLLFSDVIIEFENIANSTTDFFSGKAVNGDYTYLWLMCSDEVKKSLERMNFKMLKFRHYTH